MSATPFDRVLTYFTGDADVLATNALRRYFGPDDPYTGASFDTLSDADNPNRFTANDIVAVSMLSVTVPAKATLSLLGGEADELLSKIPVSATLWSNPELLDRDGAGWKLWSVVAAHHDVGRTIASKLLAAKRPALFPVYDQHVAAALDIGASEWGFWQAVARHPDVKALTDAVERAQTSAGVSPTVSTLRVIDVVVWMRQHGAK